MEGRVVALPQPTVQKPMALLFHRKPGWSLAILGAHARCRRDAGSSPQEEVGGSYMQSCRLEQGCILRSSKCAFLASFQVSAAAGLGS